MSRIQIEAYVEENEFKKDNGEVVKYLSLAIPVTEDTEKRIKVEQFVLSLAKERAEKKSKNPFGK